MHQNSSNFIRFGNTVVNLANVAFVAIGDNAVVVTMIGGLNDHGETNGLRFGSAEPNYASVRAFFEAQQTVADALVFEAAVRS